MAPAGIRPDSSINTKTQIWHSRITYYSNGAKPDKRHTETRGDGEPSWQTRGNNLLNPLKRCTSCRLGALPHRTSLFDVRNAMPEQSEIVEFDGLRLYAVAAALAGVSKEFFRRASTGARAAMALIKDAPEVLAVLLDGGHSIIAGRCAIACRRCSIFLKRKPNPRCASCSAILFSFTSMHTWTATDGWGDSR